MDNVENEGGLLVLIRGIPGSGKSTEAEKLKRTYDGFDIDYAHFENDDYYTDDDGVYNYVEGKHHEASVQCIDNTVQAMKNNVDAVIVSNCFLKWQTIKKYLKLSIRNNYEVLVIDKGTESYGNIHGVPDEVIEEMKKNYAIVSEERIEEYIKSYKELLDSAE